ncbi:hypothetical protein ACVIHH_008185 [Bradyrhizobium sp. USDA 4518]
MAGQVFADGMWTEINMVPCTAAPEPRIPIHQNFTLKVAFSPFWVMPEPN